MSARIETVKAWTIPMGEARKSATMDSRQMTLGLTAIAVLDKNGKRHVGLGFTGTGRYSHAPVINERIGRRLVEANPADIVDEDGELDPVKCEMLCRRNEKKGGHGERAAAIAGLSMALWDVTAKQRNEPLFETIISHFDLSPAPKRIPVYVGGGYYGEGHRGLRQEVAQLAEIGIARIKIKTGLLSAKEELARLCVATEYFPPSAVALDANGALSLDIARTLIEELSTEGFAWFEDPFDPAEFSNLSEIAKATSQSLGVGEEILALAEFRNLIRYGGLRPEKDLLMVDPAVAYGVSEYKSILDMAKESGWHSSSFYPHGGHLFSLHMAAAFNCGACEYYPFTHKPIGGFGSTKVDGGYASLPGTPGLGLESIPEMRPILEPLLG